MIEIMQRISMRIQRPNENANFRMYADKNAERNASMHPRANFLGKKLALT